MWNELNDAHKTLDINFPISSQMTWQSTCIGSSVYLLSILTITLPVILLISKYSFGSNRNSSIFESASVACNAVNFVPFGCSSNI